MTVKAATKVGGRRAASRPPSPLGDRPDSPSRLQSIRPYVVCAVLRGVSFTQERYNSFIDLQDKLHNNIARRRTLVAIGTHDLDSVEAPFSYEALPPASIEFVPLSQARAFRADALMDFYRTDPSVKHIKPYVDIIGGAGSVVVRNVCVAAALGAFPFSCSALARLPHHLRCASDGPIAAAHHQRRAL